MAMAGIIPNVNQEKARVRDGLMERSFQAQFADRSHFSVPKGDVIVIVTLP